MGIDVHDGVVFITDTYNNKVKRVFPDTRGVSTLLGSGDAGHTDGAASAAELHEPGGLSVAGDTLYIADTNNHAIRVADLRDQTVSTLQMLGL